MTDFTGMDADSMFGSVDPPPKGPARLLASDPGNARLQSLVIENERLKARIRELNRLLARAEGRDLSRLS
ncbi:MAG: hypothetical protein H6900_09370 [Rhodobacter sp.]|uniref:hypothetical protein n=1 Tax=Pararhodobacter sp. TaxID=2127056 RepID=UPI001D974D01|nr:hypothetical protein [Pararhodobacter sp.]MCB1343790.1 hypothetical protein [Paracoccaceae bacterium]MCC0073485.1 hypothetical protein [Rhodobacter sp.]HPD92125.1 hypothetical protein [Pararhodobacter sp.]